MSRSSSVVALLESVARLSFGLLLMCSENEKLNRIKIES